MTRNREIALFCRINAGGFSGERIAQVTLADGSEQIVLAPRHYCWTKDGQALTPTQPESGKPIEGIVAARLIEEAAGAAKVTTPDGEIFMVSSGTMTKRPSYSEINTNVPV